MLDWVGPSVLLLATHTPVRDACSPPGGWFPIKTAEEAELLRPGFSFQIHHQIIHSSHQSRCGWAGECQIYHSGGKRTGSLKQLHPAEATSSMHCISVRYKKALHPGSWLAERPLPPSWCSLKLGHTTWQEVPGLDSSPHLPTRPGA